MAMMGFRIAGRANGVSLLHGKVSREMFAHLWPGFDPADVPITSITNGVHAPTWVAAEIFELVKDEYGVIDPDNIWEYLGNISLQRFWETKRSMREALVFMSRERLRQAWLERGAHEAELHWTNHVLDPDILTVGFARRVPSYKRLTLMLRDPDRLGALLTHPDHPIQIVIAGKAHPADEGGKALIQQLVRFADSPEVRHRIVFLPNYDIGMATTLYPGCDIWLNNPIRPLEASGTSGMKAALNGALNLSIMDGWWDEWFDGSNGWSIPTAHSSLDSEDRDDFEAKAMYDLIESDIAPKFYRRGDDQLPQDWLEMIRHTLRTLGPKVLATRMVKEYTERLYAPASLAGEQLAQDNFRGARELAQWKHYVRDQWPYISIEHVESDAGGSTVSLGDTLPILSYVSLAGLNPSDVVIEAVYGHVDDLDVIENAHHVILKPELEVGSNRWKYVGEIPLHQSGSFGYTVRVVPSHALMPSTADLGLQVLPEVSASTGAPDIHLR
jgi:starch phosphorylase